MAQVTLITGASGALGSTLAKVLCAKGHQVAAIGPAADGERLEKVARDAGAGCLAVPFDIASSAAWSEGLKIIEAKLGAPTGAALIAGGWKGGVPLHESDDAVYSEMVKANLDTAYFTLRAILPGMVARKAGSIVVVGSRAVERPWTSVNAAAYAATKAAVVSLAEAVAAEVVDRNVRINAVLPSTMDTRANRAAMPTADFSKWVTLESASGVIAFLLGDEARDVSGAAIPLYGKA